MKNNEKQVKYIKENIPLAVSIIFVNLFTKKKM